MPQTKEKKGYRSIHKFARISPSKARLVVDTIRGKSYVEAVEILSMSKKRGSVMVKKILESAVSNAEYQEVDRRNLVVVEARVDEGPTMKRFQPKDRGRAHPIMKRTSHITIVVDEKG